MKQKQTQEGRKVSWWLDGGGEYERMEGWMWPECSHTYTELSQKKISENIISKLIWLSSATISPVTRGINKPSIIMSHRDWSSRAVHPVQSYCFALFLQELVWVWEGCLETLFIQDKEFVRKQLRERGYDLDIVWTCPLRAYLLVFNFHCMDVKGYNLAWPWFRGRTFGKWLWLYKAIRVQCPWFCMMERHQNRNQHVSCLFLGDVLYHLDIWPTPKDQWTKIIPHFL